MVIRHGKRKKNHKSQSGAAQIFKVIKLLPRIKNSVVMVIKEAL
jgi:hypothetical protein